MPEQAHRDDMQLLAAWLGGSRRAGQILVKRHYASVFVFFNTRLDPDTSADLTQATLMTLCEQGDRFRQASSLRSYLLGIARWKLVGHFRGRAATTPFDEELIPASSPRSLTSQWARREQESLLVEALRRLPLDYQLILELKDYEGLTAREMAEVFGIPPGTVATRIRRARQALDETCKRLSSRSGLAETTATELRDHMERVRASASLPDRPDRPDRPAPQRPDLGRRREDRGDR